MHLLGFCYIVSKHYLSDNVSIAKAPIVNLHSLGLTIKTLQTFNFTNNFTIQLFCLLFYLSFFLFYVSHNALSLFLSIKSKQNKIHNKNKFILFHFIFLIFLTFISKTTFLWFLWVFYHIKNLLNFLPHLLIPIPSLTHQFLLHFRIRHSLNTFPSPSPHSGTYTP